MWAPRLQPQSASLPSFVFLLQSPSGYLGRDRDCHQGRCKHDAARNQTINVIRLCAVPLFMRPDAAYMHYGMDRLWTLAIGPSPLDHHLAPPDLAPPDLVFPAGVPSGGFPVPVRPRVLRS
ncbi:hypothetical protein CHELA40_15518 [Chelatococcus asaccharovorans]|nr:hypothetical protein CHELA17_60098 [Chelatococcus asaccharovorans]CAH1682755.1 hypothetical protein CHELA40_15518 [Chelatococcus asaccharovorans]